MNIQPLHRLVPSFTLPDTRRQPVSLWNYKHKTSVVLVLCDRDCESLLQGFAAHYREYRAVDAEILVISPHASKRNDLPFPVLIDENSGVLKRLAEQLPAVLILDSYNELEARKQGPWLDGPDHDELLRKLSVVQTRCPECGAPVWTEQ